MHLYLKQLASTILVSRGEFISKAKTKYNVNLECMEHMFEKLWEVEHALEMFMCSS